MDADIKKRWVEALRSGKYKQGIGFLNRSGRYCCLGVLCDIRDSSQWLPDGSYENARYYSMPNMALLNQCGILDSEALKLTEMNDKSGKSFSQIADYIEDTL